MDGDDVVDDATGTRFDPVGMAERLTWVTSLPGGGMPTHQYVVFTYPYALPVQVVLTVIKLRGYNAYFRGYQHPMRYVELRDGLRYWRTVLNRTHMLNRCTPDSVEPPRRVDQGAKPMKWDGPPWAPYGSPWPPGYVEVEPGTWVYRSDRDSRRRYPCASCGRRYWLTDPDRPCPRCGNAP
jgi:hypothetical protein